MSRIAQTLIDAEPGAVRVNGKLGGKHPSDGMTAEVEMGGRAAMTIINPLSFKDGGPEWRCRYGNIQGIRYTVAALLASYDYLLSGEISTTEAVRRLRLMRAARSTLLTQTDSTQ